MLVFEIGPYSSNSKVASILSCTLVLGSRYVIFQRIGGTMVGYMKLNHSCSHSPLVLVYLYAAKILEFLGSTMCVFVPSTLVTYHFMVQNDIKEIFQAREAIFCLEKLETTRVIRSIYLRIPFRRPIQARSGALFNVRRYARLTDTKLKFSNFCTRVLSVGTAE